MQHYCYIDCCCVKPNQGRVFISYPISSLSLVCSAFSGRSRPPMTPVFSVFFICSYSTSLLFIQSIIVSFCLPRVLVPSILPSKTVRRRDSLLNTWPNQFSVFVGWCPSIFCFHPPLDWIGDQSNRFSLTFSKSTFQTIPVVECPLSSTSMFLRYTTYSKSESLLFFSLTSSFFSVILLRINFRLVSAEADKENNV